MSDAVTVAALPMPLRWLTSPTQWQLSDSALTATAGGVTDLFIDPQGGAPILNAPCLLGSIAGDFVFSARISVDFRAVFDAGVLLIWRDAQQWAKLCFEYSPQRRPMIVSVVNRGVSDDANGFVTTGNHIWLRTARLGAACAFHASIDGQAWQLIRHFALALGETAQIGFEIQSPTGDGCTATFDDIQFRRERLQDLRNER